MKTTADVIRLLHEAEGQLADIAAADVATRDYGRGSQLLGLANQTRDLCEQLQKLGEQDEQDRAASGVAEQASATHQSPLRARRRTSEYPRFVRQENALVKIAWSKTQKAEYEHKVPKRILSVVVPVVAKAGMQRKRFTTTEIMPVLDPKDNTPIPDYQVYVCLAWLKTIGLIKQFGRQGYSLVERRDLEAAAESSWNQLVTR